MQRTYVVILAGGTGSRLWPASKAAKPKQFLDLLGLGQSMLQLTFQRFAKFVPEKNIHIVTNRLYTKIVREQLPFLSDEQIITEPVKKNTGAAVAYAMFKLKHLDPGCTVILSPGDNMVFDLENFQVAMEQAIAFVRKHDVLLTLGKKPRLPDTTTGYIQYMNATEGVGHKVKTFLDKPTAELANTLFRSGEFLQYTGTFVWKLDTILKAYREAMPDLFEAFSENESAIGTPEENKVMEKVFSFVENVSFRAGVIYKLPEKVRVMEAAYQWTDLTYWEEVWKAHEKDYVGNAVSGRDVLMYDSANCLVQVPSEKLVIIKDLEEYIVVDSGDVLLICPIAKEGEVKSILAASRKIKIEKYL